MSLLNRLAHLQNRRAEGPNLELARELASQKDRAGIHEIALGLWNRDRHIQADCIKVLYEIGGIDPRLIAGYADDFVKALKSRNNRLVWGGMTALAEVAKVDAQAVFKNLAEIKKAKETGSVITIDHAISTLALTAAANEKYSRAIFPYLLEHLSSCRPKEVPQHAERILPAVNAGNQADFIKVLEGRLQDLGGSGLVRARKLIRKAAKPA